MLKVTTTTSSTMAQIKVLLFSLLILCVILDNRLVWSKNIATLLFENGVIPRHRNSEKNDYPYDTYSRLDRVPKREQESIDTILQDLNLKHDDDNNDREKPMEFDNSFNSADENEKVLRETSKKRSKTSCGSGLCPLSLNYPYRAINDIINEARDTLATQDSYQKNTIDPAVLNYEPRPYYDSNALNKDFNEDGCTIHSSVMRPMKGIAMEDKKPYYIVNIPSYQQHVLLFECNSGEKCDESDESSFSICEQTYRDELFLVLPTDKKQFDFSDLKLRTFKVADGCQCTVNYRENNNNAFDFIPYEVKIV